MNGFGYYSMTEPMVDTWETPFPIVSSPEEDVMPVPGWGMNPMLAGPYWIAVGDASAPSSPAMTMLTRYLVAPVLIGGVAYFASNKKWTFAAAGVLGGLMVGAMLEKKGGA
jgi:hypothetical protein